MKAKRLWWTVRLLFIRGGGKRAEYARKNNIYAGMGENVSIQDRRVPVYSELIKFHNNIAIARNVDFCNHDIIHRVLNDIPENNLGEYRFNEHIGCIEIMDNVFVGSNSIILYGTKIGSDVIIASGSVVVKDCEPNSIYAGVPARKIGSFNHYLEKRKAGEISSRISTTTHNQTLTEEEIKNAWKIFRERHEDKNI